MPRGVVVRVHSRALSIKKGVQKVSKMDAHFIETRHRSGRLAQLVRAAALHAVGQGFESLVAHYKPSPEARL